VSLEIISRLEFIQLENYWKEINCSFLHNNGSVYCVCVHSLSRFSSLALFLMRRIFNSQITMNKCLLLRN
jgi:hypothetical protein